MLFSEEELMLILKRHMPKAPAKDLESVAKSIVDTAEHWQEVDLHEKMHDSAEKEVVHSICERHAKGEKPKKVRLFYKQ